MYPLVLMACLMWLGLIPHKPIVSTDSLALKRIENQAVKSKNGSLEPYIMSAKPSRPDGGFSVPLSSSRPLREVGTRWAFESMNGEVGGKWGQIT